MIQTSFYFARLASLIFLLTYSICQAQPPKPTIPKKEIAQNMTLTQTAAAKKEIAQIMQLMQKKHFSPPKVDDNFARHVFRRYLLQLDPHQLYFTSADLATLTALKTEIDDDLNGKSWKFIPTIVPLYTQRLKEAEVEINDILSKPFDFEQDETLKLRANLDSITYPTDEGGRRKRWEMWLKYEVMRQLAAKISTDKKWEDVVTEEEKVREKIKKFELQKIKRYTEAEKGLDNKLTQQFIKIFAYGFDPHSEYMTKEEMTAFTQEVSKDSYIFGFQLDEDENGNIIIEHIAPGSPAWKSNNLHKGDIVLEIEGSNGKVVDVLSMDIDEVADYLDEQKEKITLKVKKTNGLVSSVSLMKEKFQDGDNAVKSFILKGEKKIGYISLPGFYMDWDTDAALGCANDVAKEIVKLKKENIEGLIIDVRFNGGGAMKEGIEMVGIFVNEGPISILKENSGKARMLKDPNRGTAYDGNLLVMINGQSASASELFAAGLQDYNRALLVGSTTFGKGTAQVIYALDSTQQNKPNPTCGFAKITIEKFYRVTKESNQLVGVKPHIHLPDIYEELDYNERYFLHSLKNDKVEKEVNFVPLPSLPVDALAKKSAERVAQNPAFQYINSLNENKTLSGISRNTKIALKKDAFLADYEVYSSAIKNMEDLMKTETSKFKIENTSPDAARLQVDAISKEVNDNLANALKEDVYLEECYEILKDFIDSSKP